MTRTKAAPAKKQVVIEYGEDTAVFGRRSLWMLMFWWTLILVASVTGVVATLRLINSFEHANAVHRARNEAEHICIVEANEEGRQLARRQVNWSPREAVNYYVTCVDRVTPTLVVPQTINAPMRFTQAAAFSSPAPAPSRRANPTPSAGAAPKYGRDIYVPPPSTPAPTHHSTPRPRSTPKPTRRPTPNPTPTPCNPVCVPSPMPVN